MSKSIALTMGIVIIFIFFVLSIIFPARVDAAPFLTAMVTLVSAYIALQVANNGVRGKFFNRQLWNAECDEGDEIDADGDGIDDRTGRPIDGSKNAGRPEDNRSHANN